MRPSMSCHAPLAPHPPGPQETVRAGDHAIATDALQLLQWELQAALAGALAAAEAGGDGGAEPTAAGAEQAGPASEKGVLQLLFDQRFARDVLAGAHPADGHGGGGAPAAGVPAFRGSGPTAPPPSAAAGALAQRKQQLTALEQQLQVSEGV
jgi:hypothetical protein